MDDTNANVASRDRQIAYVPLGEVEPAGRNAKTHDLPAIVASIREFGFTVPALRDERTDRLIAGHGRLEALRQMHSTGEPPPSGVREDGPTWLIPVVTGWASEDDAHAEAMLVADNRLTELGGWDDRVLAELLADVADYSTDLLHLTGYSDQDLSRLIDAAGGDGHGGFGEADPDDLPDTENTPSIAAAGDVWALGAHRLVVGDCTDRDTVEALFAPDKGPAACMWTDPPYGVNVISGDRNLDRAHRTGQTIANDQGADHLPTLLAGFLDQAATVALRPGAPGYIAHPADKHAITFGNAIQAAGWSLRQQLIWKKDTFNLGNSDYHYIHEPIWLAYTPHPGGEGFLGRFGDRWYGGNDQSTVFEIPRPKKSDQHPSTKPTDLVVQMLRNSAARGQRVYDPFGGSGTTLIACQALGMKCRMIELDAKYADVVLARYVGLTGDTAVREGDGHTITRDTLAEAAA